MKKNQISAAMTMNRQHAQHEAEEHGVRLARLEFRHAEQLLLQLRQEPSLDTERHFDRAAILHLPVLAGDLPEVRALGIVADGGTDDLVGFHQLLELILVQANPRAAPYGP